MLSRQLLPWARAIVLELFTAKVLNDPLDAYRQLGIPIEVSDILRGIRRIDDHLTEYIDRHLVAFVLPDDSGITESLDQQSEQSLTEGRGIGMIAPAGERTMFGCVSVSFSDLQLQMVEWGFF